MTTYLLTDTKGFPMARDTHDGCLAMVRTLRSADYGTLFVSGTHVLDDRGSVARIYDTADHYTMASYRGDVATMEAVAAHICRTGTRAGYRPA